MNEHLEVEILGGWHPITIEELGALGKSEYENLLTFCWKDGSYRCFSTGVSCVEITPTNNKYRDYEEYKVEWHNEDGDPSIVGSMETVIHKLEDCCLGNWEVGLYKRDEQ